MKYAITASLPRSSPDRQHEDDVVGKGIEEGLEISGFTALERPVDLPQQVDCGGPIRPAATELSRRSGRHKQVVGRIVDELEELGYVERCPDEGDRRAKLVVPTERGREAMRMSDAIIAEIERREAEVLGKASYRDFKENLQAVVESLASREVRAPASPRRRPAAP